MTDTPNDSENPESVPQQDSGADATRHEDHDNTMPRAEFDAVRDAAQAQGSTDGSIQNSTAASDAADQSQSAPSDAVHHDPVQGGPTQGVPSEPPVGYQQPTAQQLRSQFVAGGGDVPAVERVVGFHRSSTNLSEHDRDTQIIRASPAACSASESTESR